jgi:minor extracellular serine protease Vpr
MPRIRTRGWATCSALAVIVAVVALPAPARADQGSEGAQLGRYLVQVAGTPLALSSPINLRSKTASLNMRSAAEAGLALIEEAVTRLGGTVDHRYVDAINGLAVTLPMEAISLLAQTPGVLQVEPVRVMRQANTRSDTFTGASAAWADLGVTGAKVKIAIIDTGIDYTHATFGGAGAPSAYSSNDRTIIEPGTFPTPKVIAGYDFVGDDYDAYSTDPARRIPHPDADPIGCGEHGTHVAGTAAGFGVTRAGRTFAGPWTAANARTLSIGPGTAPEALLMAYQVFGCDGYVTSDIVVAAIDRAVADGADVINMSLGGDYGLSNSIDAIASDNAAKSGVVVVAAAGNSGPAPYLVGSPGTATRAISVAALDARKTLPGAMIEANGRKVSLIAANDVAVAVTGVVRVVRDANGGIGLGCTAQDFGDVAGAIAVVARGVCPRVDKAAAGQQAGAVAVIMVNQSAEFPPVEGSIEGVRIPFLGAASTSATSLTTLDGATVQVRRSIVPNPTYVQPAEFTSAGPRSGDSGIKPDLIAPGTSLVSARSGSGSLAETLSGTSMATPVVSGIAALVVQRHPDWSAAQVKAALTQTVSTDSTTLAAADRQLTGAGVIQPVAALSAPVLLLTRKGASGINFGIVQPSGAVEKETFFSVWNPGTNTQRVRLSIGRKGKGPGTFGLSQDWLTLAPGQSRDVAARFVLTKQEVSRLKAPDAMAAPDLTEATISVASGGVDVARMPVQVIVLARSTVTAKFAAASANAGQIELTNGGTVAGTAEIFDLLIEDGVDPQATVDLRAMGYRVLAAGERSSIPGDQLIVFAISQHNGYSNPARNIFTIAIDSNGDGKDDHELIGLDRLFAETGATYGSFFDGTFIAVTSDMSSMKPAGIDPIAPMNGSTILLTALASDLGITAAQPLARVSLRAESFADDPVVADTTESVLVNLWDPQRRVVDPAQVSVVVPVGGNVEVPVFVRPPTAGETTSLGWMVVCVSNLTGAKQADLLKT